MKSLDANESGYSQFFGQTGPAIPALVVCDFVLPAPQSGKSRYCDQHMAARFHDACQFIEGRLIIVKMLDDVRGQHQVETIRVEGEIIQIAVLDNAKAFFGAEANSLVTDIDALH